MKKFIFLLFLLLNLILLTSCFSSKTPGQSGYIELNDAEKRELIGIARGSLKNIQNPPTRRERVFLDQNNPNEFKVHYSSNMTGKAILIWHVDRTTMSVTFYGKFLSSDMEVKTSVLREKDPIIIKNAPQGTRPPKFSPDEIKRPKPLKQ